MNVGVLGSGAREHALQWCLERSDAVETVFAIPGNGGTHSNVPVDLSDMEAIRTVCDRHEIDLLVIGPEGPLAAGIVDAFADHPTCVFGPSRSAARLESSKVWSKRFMQRNGIPTAVFSVVDTLEGWAQFADERGGRAVLKADGLAGGKGVAVCRRPEDIETEWQRMTALRPPGERFVAEELVEGWELSIHVLTDGSAWCLFPSSQDHKPLLNGDRGPNTGGMGAFSPVSACSEPLLERIVSGVVEPTLHGLATESIHYCGFLYFGLMIASEGPVVLEYNVRLGDPETQVLLPALTSDLAPALFACLDGTLSSDALSFRSGFAAGVVLASPGYPASPQTGTRIDGHPVSSEDALIFHAGTKRLGNGWVISGGRVLTVVGRGSTVEDACMRAYAACDRIRFDGMQLRTDIGRRTAS